jgi:hypothetical protein
MNAANTYRASILGRLTMPLTLQEGTMRRRWVTTLISTADTPVLSSSSSSSSPPSSRRRTFVPVDYSEYVAECKAHRNSAYGGASSSSSPHSHQDGVYDVRWDEEEEEERAPTGGVVRAVRMVGRMVTVLPLRDANWVVVMLFVVGSVSFTINGALGLHLLLAAPDAIFPGEALVAVPVTNMIGAVLFTVGPVLSLQAIVSYSRYP